MRSSAAKCAAPTAWAVAAAISCTPALAQNANPTNDLPNPYVGRVLELPGGRQWGSTAGVDIGPDGKTVWAIDRCGSNTCVGSDLDPILQFDGNGRFVRSFGKGLFAFPHGIHVDDEGNVWVTDPLPPDGRGAGGSVGQQVTKLSPNGEILLTLGTRTVSGNGPNTFSSPSDVVVGGTATSSNSGAGPATAHVGPTSFRASTRWRSTRRAGCSSATATTTASRSSTRTETTSTAGTNSAVRVESTSTRRTTCTSPTPNRATLPTPVARRTAHGCEAFAWAVPGTGPSDTSSRIRTRAAARAPRKA
jgi:hypothetical protein